MMISRRFIAVVFSFLFLISCSENAKKDFLFSELSSSETGIDFENQLTEDEDHSIINYIYFYNGGGVSAGDINNDGLPDLYFVSNQNPNKLYLNKGNFQFEDITDKAGVSGSSDWSTGSTMVDINGDGLLDIYVCAVSELLDFKGHNELFINNGDGTFTEKSAEYGLDFTGYSTQAYFFDFDKDDDLDVYIVNHAVHTSLSHGPAKQRNKRAPLVGDVLMQNNNGKFEDISEKAGIFGGVNGYGLSASIADFNNDGWDDLYVCNDFHEDDYYYINNQDGTFSEQLASSFSTISRFSMGSDAADINGDGNIDLMTLDMLPNDERVLKETEGDDVMLNMQTNLKNLGYRDQYSRNMLQINSDDNYFYESAFFNGVSNTDWSWAPLFADFNNDGHQDLFISNGILRRPNSLDFKKYVSNTFKTYGEKEGLKWLFKSINEMPKGEVPNQIFEGNSRRFSEQTGQWMEKKSSLSNGAIYVDLDLDGDLDLVANNINATASVFENTLANKNHLSVSLSYQKQNQGGIGAKVLVHANGKMQKKEVYPSRGFLSSMETKVHFGLDSLNSIDSVQVIWPNGNYQTVQNPAANTELKISYSESAKPFNFAKDSNKKQLFKPTKSLEFTHTEDTYNDFYNERLIPYKISTLGPAMAVADIDNNGYEDVFIGGASNKAGELFLNNGRTFKKSNQPGLEKDAPFEDNDAIFFDADNDGDLDLYIASGIHESRNKSHEFDRLYLNVNGKFKRTDKQILYNPLNTSTVTAYDYDQDGDEDVFIGNLSNPGNFGATVNSAILNNNGKGKFTVDTNFSLNSKVTDATWVDINDDGIKDLIIACEWDTPKIYINNNGVLTAQESSKDLAGLWQSVGTFDMDNDGDLDILLGNWGENTKFENYKDHPILYYYGDFDGNGVKEALISYNVNGNYYPLDSKDMLASQMNVMNKRFVKHQDFALKTIDEVVTKESLDKATKKEIRLLSSGYLENNGGDFSKFVRFSDELQLGPIKSFQNINFDGEEKLLVSGNSEAPTTYHGYYLSLQGYLVGKDQKIEPVSNYGIAPFKHQIKGTYSVAMKDKNVLFVVANNQPVVTYSYPKN
ncbi:MAG: hypothetical protein CMB99_09695 [Flavobacteriaceae bacterium]|nr:hypothetical protein [Flavobacteriaceae bacterium]|tara:strand:- start:394686 stop:397931 length:3246 start_codon:yes stop_codon:yes gene_type:complete